VNTRAREQLLAAMSEEDLLAAVTARARQGGWLHYHVRDSRRSLAGFPDLVLVHPEQHRLAFVELKTERGHLSPPQGDWLLALWRLAHNRAVGVAIGQPARATAAMRQAVLVAVWRPSDLDAITAMLVKGAPFSGGLS
jgi:hypothetical protein